MALLFPLRTLTTTARSPPNRTRVAIVTGAARGIGRAISLRLARDGYAVSVSDLPEHTPELHSLTTEIQNISLIHTTSSNLRSYAHPADVTSPKQVQSLVQKTVDVLGPLHTMVANAGIAQVKPLLELTPDDFRRMFDVNVLGVHYCFQAAARQMILQRDRNDGDKGGEEVNGKLIAAASIVAFRPFPLLGHYTASKWAVRGLAQAYATELASERITANAYAPGIVDTKMWELIDQGLGERRRAKGSR
ncbi:hypothetical protein N0V88_004139 [Collariella sp. IMI 366227]|nr:hypothetical protein N0V88_004139 [Collariella sp. IMI 366227]